MGLGKTLQAVLLSALFLGASRGDTVLIIVPKTTVLNWANEFDK